MEAIRTICVLGCGGFIGSHLVGRLLRDSTVRVCGIDLSAAKIRDVSTADRLEFVREDIHDIEAIRRYVERSDIVVSLAALCNPALYTKVPLAVIESNFVGPFGLVRLCSETGKWLIHFSTSEVYGRTPASLTQGIPSSDESRYVLNEDSSPLILGPIAAQRWCYASAKQLLERALFAYGFEKGLRYTIVRPFNFIGPRMDFFPGVDGEGIPRVLACFMEALMGGRPMKLVNGGEARRCFTYIDDAIDAVGAMMDRPDAAQGQVFNIGNPANETTIAELASMMTEIFCELRPGTAVPSPVSVSGEAFYGPGYEDSDRRMPDVSKARRLLGWSPRTSLRPALRAAMEYYLEHYGIAYPKNGMK